MCTIAAIFNTQTHRSVHFVAIQTIRKYVTPHLLSFEVFSLSYSPVITAIN
jgi:hypothetical protein